MSMTDSVEKHIRELYGTCREAGWDGRSASPMSGKCLRTALAFAGKVPPSFPPPSAAVLPCGTLELEWSGGSSSVVKIRFKRDGSASYEAVKQGKLRSGKMPSPEVFEEILIGALTFKEKLRSRRP